MRQRSLWLGALLALLAVVLPLGASQRARAQAEPMDLLDAISQGLVRAEFSARGPASGSVALVNVRRLVEQDMVLTISSGWVLRNENLDEQDVVVRGPLGVPTTGLRYREARQIEITSEDTYPFVLEGYCIEAHKENPSVDAVLTPDASLGSAALSAVTAAVEQVPASQLSVIIVQAAIWAVTDDITAQQLDDVGYTVSANDIAVARRIILAAGLDPASYRLFSGA